MRPVLKTIVLSLVIAIAINGRVRAVEIGNVDDFQNGASGWRGSGPIVVQTGGPGGDGDAFLQVDSNGGNGPGSRLAVFNTGSVWVGDYAAAGVASVDLDIMNMATSSSDMAMRLVLFGPNSTSDRWTSTDPIVIPNDGQWQRVSFPITSETITSVGVAQSYDEMLENVIRVMVRHDLDTPSGDGTRVVATVGLDNISIVGMTVDDSDFNGDGVVDVQDVDLLLAEVKSGANTPRFDRTGDGLVDQQDIAHVITLPDELNTYIGDVNFDDEFNSSDLVIVLGAGQFDDGVPMNSTWESGDWTGDAEFNSADIIVALQGGSFGIGPRAATSIAVVPEPATCVLLSIAGLLLASRFRA